MSEMVFHADAFDPLYTPAVIVHRKTTDASVALCNALSRRGTRTVFMVDGGKEEDWAGVHASVLIAPKTPTAEWLNALKILCRLKRGPKVVSGIPLAPVVHNSDGIEMRA
jgi:hypothetical protein